MTSFIPDSRSCQETRTIFSRPSRNSLASTVWIRLSFPTRVEDFERFACLYRTPCTTRCTHRAAWYLVLFDRIGRSHRTLKPCTLDTGRGISCSRTRTSLSIGLRDDWRLQQLHEFRNGIGLIFSRQEIGYDVDPLQRVTVLAASFHRTQHALKQPCNPLQNPALFWLRRCSLRRLREFLRLPTSRKTFLCLFSFP